MELKQLGTIDVIERVHVFKDLFRQPRAAFFSSVKEFVLLTPLLIQLCFDIILIGMRLDAIFPIHEHEATCSILLLTTSVKDYLSCYRFVNCYSTKVHDCTLPTGKTS